MSNRVLWNRDFMLLWFCSFLQFLTVHSLITTLPVYVTGSLSGAEKDIGLVLLLFMLGAIAARPIAGKIVDQNQSMLKMILYLTSLMYVLGSIGYIWIDGIYSLTALRFIHGFGFGAVSTVTMTIVNNMLPEEHKGEGLGYFSLSMTSAVVLGPFLGFTIIQEFNFMTLFVFCIGYTLIAFLLGFFFHAPEHPKEKKVVKHKGFRLGDYFEKRAVPIALIGACLAVAQTSINSYISVYALELGIVEVVSYFFLIYSLMMFASRTFSGKIMDSLGPGYIVYPSLTFYFIGLVMISLLSQSYLLLLTGLFIGLGYGAIFPSFQTIALQRAGSENSGKATSTFFIFMDLGLGGGAMLLGLIASQTSYTFMYQFCAVLVLISCFSFYLLQKKDKKQHTEHTEKVHAQSR